MNLHWPRWEYAFAQLRLSAMAISYSTIASSYRCCARNTWPLAKCAIGLRGDAATLAQLSSSARTISAATVSVILSRTRAVSSITSQLCAATDCDRAPTPVRTADRLCMFSRDGGFDLAARPRKM